MCWNIKRERATHHNPVPQPFLLHLVPSGINLLPRDPKALSYLRDRRRIYANRRDDPEFLLAASAAETIKPNISLRIVHPLRCVTKDVV
jgi:hypothetical protein